ncbi:MULTISPECIES: glutathione S-transferase C-terminal domain-containing protein [Moorena]|uniref:glutathione S-transferase C-terminal domain-containing protein n=1 Tax=Moorena TaxID=1155738 RepID=UPI000AB6ADB6|nr:MULTISPECIES: glutathione S-transferase C-terminal domain-containing protein [Moorena]
MTNNLAPTPYRAKIETSINRLLPIFEEQLAQSQYLLSNDTWTAADVAALCSLGYYSLRLNEDWVLQYPNIGNWFDKLHERESVKSTVPMPLN